MKYIKAAIKRLISFLHCMFVKALHPGAFRFSIETMLAPSVSISITNNGRISIGNKVGIRKGSTISSDGGTLRIADRCFINSGCVITAHKSIAIGKGTRLGPHCMIFDHDYDYRNPNGFERGDHLVSDIEIGENVWIGAGSIILRGTKIGNNTVVGAGCVIKGVYPDNALILQKRNEVCNVYNTERVVSYDTSTPYS